MSTARAMTGDPAGYQNPQPFRCARSTMVAGHNTTGVKVVRPRRGCERSTLTSAPSAGPALVPTGTPFTVGPAGLGRCRTAAFTRKRT